MLDVPKMVETATLRAHRATCRKNPGDCNGATQTEMMVTAMVVESTLPAILDAISQEFKQVLHAMAAGLPRPGEPDATGESAEELLAEWFRWWRDDITTPAALPGGLQVRTGAYLTVQAVTAGRTVRRPGDL